MTVPWMAAKIVLRPVGELRAHGGNARLHSAEQIEQIKASMLAFGFTNPLLVDEDGVLIAGHGRLEAAQALGIAKVPVIVLKHLSPGQRDALRLADNRIAENATWDQALLRDALAGLQQAGEVDLLAIGFSQDEIGAILAAADEAVTDGDARDEQEGADADGEGAPAVSGGDAEEDDPADDAPEPPRQAVARIGDVWCLGDHRLACGDSTDARCVARVMAGERAVLLFTSPPYGSQRNYTTGGIADWDALMRGVFQHAADALAADGQILVNLGLTHRDNEWHPYWQGWIEWMRTIGWRRFGWYVWDQGPGLPGDWNGRLAPSFEFLFHFNRQARQANKTVPCKWAGDPLLMSGLRRADGTMSGNSHEGRPIQEFRIPDNVVRITRHKERGIEVEHPAVFPVKLPAFAMEAFSQPGDLVFEPFAGSGTTILAGQRTGRQVRAIELAPAYVDLAIARWRQNHPDLLVTLDGDGWDYDAIAAERTAEQESAHAA
ncbi:MAG: site-specific DNA-methyltransferase [Acetobacteraceae bacterium]|nr:site-specific DNA-methyltransferase [Acetobacteraceae bacterium]